MGNGMVHALELIAADRQQSQRHENSGDNASHEDPARGHIAQHGQKHQGDAWGNDGTQDGGAAVDSRGEILRIAVLAHFRNQYRGNCGTVSRCGTGNAGHQHIHKNGSISQAALEFSDKELGENNESFGHAGQVHQLTHQHEERNGQQRVATDAVHKFRCHQIQRRVVAYKQIYYAGDAHGGKNFYAEEHKHK